jgi:large subunit ribosomal protein L25
MDQLEITANNRTAFGKKNRALRREGIIPIHVYGLGQPSLSLQAEIKPLTNTLITAGRTTPVTIKTDESSTVVLIRDVDRHAVSGNIQHVDFLRVDAEKPVDAPVPLVLFNQESAPGTAGGAGVVTQGIYEVTVRAKPFDVPAEIQVDCIVLESIELSITTKDLKLPPGVELVSSDTERVAWIQPPRVEVEPVQSEELDESLEGEGDSESSEATQEGDSSEQEN